MLPPDGTQRSLYMSSEFFGGLEHRLSDGESVGTESNKFSADSNLLAYVVTKDNSTSYKTYVYDKSNRDKTSPGCSL